MPIDWETLYDCNNGRLEWLEYNIKRVLGIDCVNDEKEMGIEQVKETIQHIIYYAKMKNPEITMKIAAILVFIAGLSSIFLKRSITLFPFGFLERY